MSGEKSMMTMEIYAESVKQIEIMKGRGGVLVRTLFEKIEIGFPHGVEKPRRMKFNMLCNKGGPQVCKTIPKINKDNMQC
jgi:hypothetical protein